MSCRPGRAGVDMQFAEIAAEPLVGVNVHRLIAKEQNLVLRERLMQLLDLAVAERIGECDALNHGTDARRNRRDLDGFIAHGRPSILLETISARADGTRAHCAMAIPAIQYDQSPCDQSALAPESFTPLAHFSVSCAMSLPKSSGEPGIAMPPRSANRAFTLESTRPALTSRFNLWTMSAAVPVGAPTPYQALA